MSFGFADTGGDGDKEIKYKVSDVLKYQKWDSIKEGVRVKSLLTGSEGSISGKEELLERIFINWDNGKSSKASKCELTTVIVI